MANPDHLKAEVLARCQPLFPAWEGLSVADFDFDAPKGFSSFTMGIRARSAVEPSAVLYRRLEGKENAILDFEAEKEVFLTLAAHRVAPHCHHYDDACRIEAFYHGRTLAADDLFQLDVLRKIAAELYRFHRLRPPSLPQGSFWDLLFDKWGRLARKVLEDRLDAFPPEERPMGEALRQIYHPDTLARVKRCLPEGPLCFCHNDTYHGNIMRLDGGDIRLLDFEFSCLNHPAYDFSNLFAETVMRHQQPAYPYFRIAAPEYREEHLAMLINFYLDRAPHQSPSTRERAFQQLLADTKRMLPLSHFKYALAAIPLAVHPIQKIRFLPYAHERFSRFLETTG